jgi:diketogulonate reductase-like aldo/keto reductase
MSTITDIKGKFKLHNDVEIPYLGLGVYLSKDGSEVENAVNWAFDAGYRHIDTASAYKNEAGVGKAIRESCISREEIFVTTKVWNTDQGYDTTLKAFDESMNKLGLNSIDLYLVHWPVKGKYKETWRALEELYASGRVRAIGVSNFLQHHLEDLLSSAKVVPMVNQMEFHPWLVQQRLLDFCVQNNIRYQAWSPLMQGRITDVAEIKLLAHKYGKTPVQLVLRWNLQKGVITIPKSSNRDRIQSNADIFDFQILPEDMTFLDSLDRSHRFGPDPDTFDF